MATHSSVLFGQAHGQRSLAGYSLWGHKELDATEHTPKALTTVISKEVTEKLTYMH